jgi:dTDP-4-dehydrorhamnose reductase
MRIFLTGSEGQLGTDLLPVLANDEVIAPSEADMDLRDADSVRDAIVAAKPEVVMHVAAFTAVDRCETEPELAHAVNAVGTENVAAGARAAGAHVLYVSTDYVFDGSKPDPYVETDTPNPISVYGRTKLAGEQALAATDTVVRTSWVVGAYGANMVKTILRLAESNPELSFVDDQRGHPTFTADLASMMRRLAEARAEGIFHVTNQSAVSWFEFAQAVLSAAGEDPNRVSPIATADLQPARPAPRPANSVLDNASLRREGYELLADFHEPLQRVVTQLLSDS